MALARNLNIVDCSRISPAQLVLAIYNNYQRNSLYPDQAIYPSHPDYAHELKLAVELANNKQAINKIFNGKIEINLDFSTWPLIDASLYDKIVMSAQQRKFRRLPLNIIVESIVKNDQTLTTTITKQDEASIKWHAYSYLDTDPQTFLPEQTTIDAVATIKKSNTATKLSAADIGAGSGRDTYYLLLQGFNVTAFEAADKQIEALLVMQKKMAAQLQKNEQEFSIIKKTFDEISATDLKGYQLIIGSWSFPYAGKGFTTLFNTIKSSLPTGGVVAGQLFGAKNTFVTDKPVGEVAVHDEKEINELFPGNDFELKMRVAEKPGKKMDDTKAYDHTFHVVAMKL